MPMMGVCSIRLAQASSTGPPLQQGMLLGVVLTLWTGPSSSPRMESQWVCDGGVCDDVCDDGVCDDGVCDGGVCDGGVCDDVCDDGYVMVGYVMMYVMMGM